MAEHFPTSASPAFAAHLRAAARDARLLYDPDAHVTWRVYELAPAPTGRRHVPTLVFEHEFVVRRVQQYPVGWRALDDASLLALAWHR